MTHTASNRRLQRRARQALCAALLAPVLCLAYFLAFYLRFEGRLSPGTTDTLLGSILWVVLTKLVVFGWFHQFQGWKRLVTFHDLQTLGKAAAVSSIFVVLLDYALLYDLTIPRSIVLIDWGITIFAIGGLRCISRAIRERDAAGFLGPAQTPVFIVGANESGEALLREIRRSNVCYRVAGFIAADASSLGQRIGGVPVVGTLTEACDLAERYNVEEILITAEGLSGQQVRGLVEAGQANQVPVKVFPSYEQLLQGQVDLRPRTVSIEDLLRRDPVALDQVELHQWLNDRVLLVTGSSGSIGSEICRQLLQFSPRKLVLLDRSENGQFFLERELKALAPFAEIEVCIGDITDAMRMNQVFREHQPDIVFHAAAYKHVPLMEAHPGEAVKNITLATRLLADLANQNGVHSFVMISTDKAINPTSVMGACKRAAELYVQSLAAHSDCRFVTVRFGNVLDSAGSVVPIFREQIARGGPVTVTDPAMQRFFMTIPEASQLVIQAGAMGEGGEIFVLDMGDPVRIVDLATDMIRLSGLEVGRDIEIQFTGLRPGEKLYEELYASDEIHDATRHSKILVAKSPKKSLKEVARALQHLGELADTDAGMLLAVLGDLVPEYVGQGAGQERRAA